MIGEILVSANLLTGVVYPGKYGWYRWLLTDMDPVDHVAYSYLVFRTTPGNIMRLNRAGRGQPAGVDKP